MNQQAISLTSLSLKAAIVHTITYMIAGIAAFTLADYETAFSQPPLSYFMRPISDPMVMAGPLFQPIRGLIFALAIYPFREVIFGRYRGWLLLWWLLVALGILSTFGPSPGSVEGMIYTVVPPMTQFIGLWEVLAQSLMLSAILCFWVRNPTKRWVNWTLTIVFALCMILPALGLLVGRQ